MTLSKCFMVAVAGALMLACSADEPGGNVFDAQTDAISKAEDATRMMEEAADAQRKAIDAQGR